MEGYHKMGITHVLFSKREWFLTSRLSLSAFRWITNTFCLDIHNLSKENFNILNDPIFSNWYDLRKEIDFLRLPILKEISK